MAIPMMEEDVEVISKLGDVPGSDDGLSTTQLKASFDLASVRIKNFINNILIPELNMLVDVESLVNNILDTTLTLSDKAANAKSTGDALKTKLNTTGGTMSGAIDMSRKKIENIGIPTNDADAVNKKYVDDADATNKRYVDNAKNEAVNFARKVGALINWLDNSYFADIIAQAGLNGLHGSIVYCADRWKASSNKVLIERKNGFCRLTNNSTSTSVYIAQRVTGLSGKTVTFVVKVNCQNKFYIAARKLDDTTIKTQSYDGGTGVFALSMTIPSDADTVEFRFYPSYVDGGGGYGDIYWAAVYEGEYTAETAPEYHQKGYAEELLACQRYFCKANMRNIHSALPISGSVFEMSILLPTEMRVTPTVEFDFSDGNGSLYQGASGDAPYAFSSATASVGGKQMLRLQITVPSDHGCTVYREAMTRLQKMAFNADL